MKTNQNRLIKIFIVFFFLATAKATQNWTNRTVPRFQHAYYSYPHRSCESFSRPYARSMCIELERIHKSTRQPFFSPPTKIDQRVMNETRELRPKPVPVLPAVEHWKETKIDKTRKNYEKLSERILSWEDKKRKKAKRKLQRTERDVEKRRMKAIERFRDVNERIAMIAASARAHAYENRMKQELEIKEKANLMRTTGKHPSTCY